MARRNRKNGRTGNRPLYWSISVCTLAAALGMVYLHLYNTCERLERTNKKLEQERTELQELIKREEHSWESLSSIRNMDALMKQHGIVMTWPESSRIIHIADTPSEPPLYAQRRK